MSEMLPEMREALAWSDRREEKCICPDAAPRNRKTRGWMGLVL